MASINPPVPGSEPVARPARWLPALVKKPSFRLLLLLLLLAALLVIQANALSTSLSSLADRFQTFVTIFLSLFIEAAPFLLAGSVVSGLIEVFVDQKSLERFVPRRPVLAALAGASLGIAFPVCECGVVPVTRRLYQKGLPLSTGIAFLLAAPVINPVAIASTYAAFGWGPIFLGRVGFTFLIAAVAGLIFTWARPDEILLAETLQERQLYQPQPQASRSPRSLKPLWEALAIAGDDFLDMGRYLIIGALLAAGMQTVVPQATLLALGGGALSSVIVMMALAFILSVCSTVDAFLALAFANTFTPASILAFLVFGPMIDIKSSLMFLGVFRRRTVLYLILLPMLMTLLIAVYLNLNVRW